jgi:hypothetical protein
MFAEYMDEIQDPKYREETESYIDQLEKEEKVPQGKELVRCNLMNFSYFITKMK